MLTDCRSILSSEPCQSRTSAVADDDRSRTRRRGRCWMGHGCWPTKRTMTTGRPACKLLQLTPDLKQMWCKPMERKSIRFHSPCIFWKEKHGFIWHFSAACILTWSGRSSVHTACGCCTGTFWLQACVFASVPPGQQVGGPWNESSIFW